MPTPTPELGLEKALDADDTADYLDTGLANSLTTIDSLFSNVSGHTHGGVHQGGPISAIPVSAIPDGSITSAKIEDGTLQTVDLADNSVTSAKIADGTIQTIDLADGSVTAAKLAQPITLTAPTITAPLVVQGAALAGPAGSTQYPLIVQSAGANNMQFMAGFERVVAGGDWSTAAMVLGYNVDTAGHVGGWLSLYDGRLGVNMYPTVTADTVQVAGSINLTSGMTAAGTITAGNLVTSGSLTVQSGNSSVANQLSVGTLVSAGRIAGSADMTLATNLTVSGSATVVGGAVIANGGGGQMSIGTAPYSSYRLTLPNLGSPAGEGIAQGWLTYACVDHAREAGLPVIPIADATSKLRSLDAYYYEHMNLDEDNQPLLENGAPVSTPTYGMSPSEVAAVIPELAGDNSVDYGRLVSVLWTACQEMDARLTAGGL